MRDTHIKPREKIIGNKALAWDILFNMFQPPVGCPEDDTQEHYDLRERMLNVLKMAEELTR